MQVRVLRHAQPGTSAAGAIGPENSGGDQAQDGALVIEVKQIQWVAPDFVSTLVLRPSGGGDVPAWLPGPRAEFHTSVLALEQAAPRATLCIWPAARAAVSDVPSLRAFLNAALERARPWLFLLDPVSMLTPEMLGNAEDHLIRIFEALAAHEARWATLLCDGVVEGEDVRPVPLGSGTLTPVLLRLWERAGRPGPVVLLEEDLAGQRALLPA
jgi:hypothetical protein